MKTLGVAWDEDYMVEDMAVHACAVQLSIIADIIVQVCFLQVHLDLAGASGHSYNYLAIELS